MTPLICDVSPRDGLQNEPTVLPPGVRAELVNRLSRARLPAIEVASFVSPKAVPQMAAAEEVVAALDRRPVATYSGLVVNARGYERLRRCSLGEVRFAFAVTETFNRRNANLSVDESVAAAGEVIEQAHRDGLFAAVTIGAAFGCPFEGSVDPRRVVHYAEKVAAAGADDVILADTIGVAVPSQVYRLLRECRGPGYRLGVHLHDTRNTGLANAYAAVQQGVEILDASAGGIGGCPFAPRATGNIPTEDLVYLLEREGITTGIDLDELIRTALWLTEVLGHELPGHVHRAGAFAIAG